MENMGCLRAGQFWRADTVPSSQVKLLQNRVIYLIHVINKEPL